MAYQIRKRKRIDNKLNELLDSHPPHDIRCYYYDDHNMIWTKLDERIMELYKDKLPTNIKQQVKAYLLMDQGRKYLEAYKK